MPKTRLLSTQRVSRLYLRHLPRHANLCHLLGWCSYCRQTKKTLTDLGAAFRAYELDQIGMPSPHKYLTNLDNGEEIQAYLAEKTGQRTVPNVFIEGKHIGGNSDLQRIKTAGRLKDLLIHAGATSS